MLQTDGHRVGAGGEVGEDADDGGGLLPNTEPVVAECSLLGCNLKLGLAAI